MSDKSKIKEYTDVLIDEFAKRHRITVQESFEYLNKYQAIDFINEFYDVEHTLSIDNAVDDITVICRNNGGAL